MRIVTYRRIKEFSEKHKDAEVALRDWYFKTEKANWNTFSDVKRTFAHVDLVSNHRMIFNIKGNRYRLVAIVLFTSKKVYIRFIGTHADYDKIDCSSI